jgi:antitoxin component YwqK of YwqJK toxin-antitoxin module
MKFLSTLFLCTAFITLHAQKTEQLFDYSFKPTKAAGRYYVVTEQKGDRWFREAYYIPETSQAMQGWYKDAKCEIADGEIIWYHPNRNIQSKVNYRDGRREGISVYYHDKGMMSDSANYSGDHLNGISLGWNSEGYQIDSSNFDGTGNGVAIKWYPKGPVSLISYYTNDTTRIGRWKHYHPNGTLMATEDFSINGNKIACACFDDKGNKLDSLLCSKEQEANFPGGASEWLRFLQKNLKANVPVKNRAPEGYYTVMIQFVVNKEGQITDIKPLTKLGFGMEDEVIRLLKKSPKWVPAFQFGRTVNAYRKQPVTFAVTKE